MKIDSLSSLDDEEMGNSGFFCRLKSKKNPFSGKLVQFIIISLHISIYERKIFFPVRSFSFFSVNFFNLYITTLDSGFTIKNSQALASNCFYTNHFLSICRKLSYAQWVEQHGSEALCTGSNLNLDQ